MFLKKIMLHIELSPPREGVHGLFWASQPRGNAFKTNSDNKLKQASIGAFFGKSSGS